MSDLTTARKAFLRKVEEYAPGQSSRFAPVLDELILWSDENQLEFSRHLGLHDVFKYCLPGSAKAFWSVTPRTGDGAKFSLLSDPRFPEVYRTEARNELAQIDRKPETPSGVPVMAFSKLIWGPYRDRVQKLMTRLLEGVQQPVAV
jgi:hypothetical protein